MVPICGELRELLLCRDDISTGYQRFSLRFRSAGKGTTEEPQMKNPRTTSLQ